LEGLPSFFPYLVWRTDKAGEEVAPDESEAGDSFCCEGYFCAALCYRSSGGFCNEAQLMSL
jgi:hypothetical protein